MTDTDDRRRARREEARRRLAAARGELGAAETSKAPSRWRLTAALYHIAEAIEIAACLDEPEEGADNGPSRCGGCAGLGWLLMNGNEIQLCDECDGADFYGGGLSFGDDACAAEQVAEWAAERQREQAADNGPRLHGLRSARNG